MAYENVNSNKLQSALNKIDNINSNKINNLISKLQTDQWESQSRKRIITALNVIANETKIIQSKIKKYKTAANYIEEYKKLDRDLDGFNNKLSNFKESLGKCDDDSLSKDYYQNKVYNYQSKIFNNKSRMTELKNKINNLIN